MEKIALIRKYLRGNCNEEEVSQVEDWLKTDAEFKALYEEEKTITLGIGKAERERLKGILQEEQKSSNTYWYIAAAIVPILIVSYLFISQKPDYEALFAENYETYGVYEFGRERGNEIAVDSLEISTFEYYQSDRFQEALISMQSLYLSKPNQGLLFYQAICHIELGEYEAALPLLDRVTSDSDYYQVAQWYKALTLLKLKRLTVCRQVLEELQSANGGIAKKATQLLERL